MKVLHLASWYPNRTGEQNGDFIQRHLKAIATLMPVHVIHVVKDQHLNVSVSRSTTQEGNLTETIVYYRPLKTGISLVDKLISLRTYIKVSKSEINAHMSEHGRPDLVHVHVAMRSGVAALWMKRRYGIPFVVTEHWTGYHKSDPENYFAHDKLFRYYTTDIFRNASWVTGVSANLVKRLSDIFAVRNTSVIFNVVNTQLFYYDPLNDVEFRFIHISNMHPNKNIEGILTVLARLKEIRYDWKLTMVGIVDPSYRQLAVKLGIDEQIVWRGSVDHVEVPAEIQKSDALLMFSNLENLSCVVCESLCCGLPVITTRVGGLPEIVNGSNGRLCSPGNEAELLKEILHLMGRYNKYDRPKISSAAAELFNEPLIGGQFVSLYKRVLNRS